MQRTKRNLELSTTNPEFILGGRPDIIFFADAQCCSQTVESISERLGGRTTAVRNQHVFEMNADIASRWGPQFVQFWNRSLGPPNSS